MLEHFVGIMRYSIVDKCSLWHPGNELMSLNLEFNHKKAAQALNYFAIRNGGMIDQLKAIKLVYFADRFHLRKYGRLITNDTYFAMSYGPVASGVRDIAQANDLRGDDEREYANEFISRVPDSYNIQSVKLYDSAIFSDSDIEALNFAWEKFGSIRPFELSELSHEYPEWKKHKNDLKISSRVKINLKDFFDDPPEPFDKCYALSPEEKSDNIALLKERFKLEALWE